MPSRHPASLVSGFWTETKHRGDFFPTRLPLPAWARFMGGTGDLLAHSGDRPITIGLTLPTRGFAAAIAAAGAVARRDALKPATASNLKKHVSALRSTPAGTPVSFQSGTKVHSARWLGIEKVNDTEMLRFETRGKMTRSLPLKEARSVRITGEKQATKALQARNVFVPTLLAAVLRDGAGVTFMSSARADCVIVGTQTVLEPELTQQHFFTSGQIDDPSKGTLQDIVRAREVAGASRFYRTVLVASTADPRSAEDLDPPLVIFDGGRAYVRWRDRWPTANQLVILDRSMTNAEDAAYELSMSYAERADDVEYLNPDRVPGGIECVTFARMA